MSDSTVIETFYSAFQKKDYETMASCYHPEATFRDEVFNLKGNEIGLMWRMLCTRGKDLELTFSDITENSAQWEAVYTFSQTGRKVHNKIDASFKFKDGKILEHIDSFNFYKWTKMALGLSGMFLGWTSFLRKKVASGAMHSLHGFIKQVSND